jgi:predicted Rossmann fold flavoprotein
MQRIGIIWGGAAGMMCAAVLVERLRDMGLLESVTIDLFERNIALGRKVAISWGGRCNVTTGIIDRKSLATKYTRGYEFYAPTLAKYGPRKIRDFFESRGLPLKCEEDNRVFPVSDHGQDVINFFIKILSDAGVAVQIHYGSAVQSVNPSGPQYQVVWSGRKFIFDTLVLATGGNAYAHTGSSGDGYTFARALGHSITPLGPSLSSFETTDTWAHALSGISFPQARVVSTAPMMDGVFGRVYAEGPLLLTHFGITGPSPFTLSSHLAFAPIDRANPLSVALIPVAGMSVTDWDRYIADAAQTQSVKTVGSILGQVLPKRFVEWLGVSGLIRREVLEKKWAVLSRAQRQEISTLLGWGIPLSIVARRAGDEFVTAGGASESEIDSSTLESKLHKNLYFAGEILNIDGVTGGFNLQVAWSTGWRVAESIVESKEK